MGSKRGEPPVIFPKFVTRKCQDIMIRGGGFYAIWNEQKGCWSTDRDDVINLIDAEMEAYKKKNFEHLSDAKIAYMWDSESGSIDKWNKYVEKQTIDNFHPLDDTLTFLNTEVKRENYASKRLPYALEAGPCEAWDELVGTLYAPEERHKIEWAIGSVVAGDSRELQKFFVFYGEPGCGKGTVLEIIGKLFGGKDGYCGFFEAQALGNKSAAFALAPFKNNPLVAIDKDGDLSRLESNTQLNKLVSHEEVVMNDKFEKSYPTVIHSLLFVASNKPVRITDSKSGLLRRLIDISPVGKKIPIRRYMQLKKNIDFELGAIAAKCLEVYRADPHYYDDYVPTSMMGATNHFFNFVEEYYDEFKNAEYVTLNDAWFKYRLYCEDAKIPYPYHKMAVKEELKNYFLVYKERMTIDGEQRRNVYSGFRLDKFQAEKRNPDISDTEGTSDGHWLHFDKTESLLDKIGAEWPAQYAYIRDDGSDQPSCAWDRCETILKDLNTAELHYLRCPEQFAFIDFDKKDPVTGEKSLKLNLEAAEKWPPTYAELSKSGQGIHLTYIFNGDISKVAAVYEDDVEIKFYTGKSSLRRKLTRCNDLPIATISSGLPLRKEAKKTIEEYSIKDAEHLVNAIRKAMRKEIAPYSTVCCVDYIGKVLNEAYESGMKYDVTELKPQVLAFAGGSHHHALECMDKAEAFPYKSEDESQWVPPPEGEREIAFFDTEVFPNLFIFVYKVRGQDCVTLINPEGPELMRIFQTYNLIGFNNVGYDNHICYARMRGDSIYELFVRSQNIINSPKGRNDWTIAESKNLSYTDIFDFCATKQSLKKWEIALQKKGVEIRHDEAGLPWDQPVPKEKWKRVAEYCCNDVIATEKVFEANQADFHAREILVALVNALRGPGSTVNDSTNNLTARFIVGDERNPQASFVKPDLTKLFPGYEYSQYGFPKERYMVPVDDILPGMSPKHFGFYEMDWEPVDLSDSNKRAIYGPYIEGGGKPDAFVRCIDPNVGWYEKKRYTLTKDEVQLPGKVYYRCTMISGKSWYKGYDPGEGGLVFANWGMYGRAECYDVASMHPSSLIAENGFGPYTENFKMLKDIRLHIKHKDYDWVRSLYNGLLAPYVTSDEDAKALSYALKIAINSVYGLTAAHFNNKLRDPRNDDNWVAKRGALFMIDLMLAVKAKGYRVIHVKTDSIKVANPDADIFNFVYEQGQRFGYTFEIEHKFEKLCLVNNAVYICKYTDDPENGKAAGQWDATGDQFKEPYVFKTLFSHEDLNFWDLTVTQTVKVGGGLFLDYDECLPSSEALEKEEDKLLKKWHKAQFELTDENDAKLTDGFSPMLTDISDKKLSLYTAEQFHSDYIRLCEIRKEIDECHSYQFIGRAGLFCPVKTGFNAGRLVRENNGKYAYAAGSKGYRWLEAEVVKEFKRESEIDNRYFEDLARDAVDTISYYGNFEEFAS